jgi:ribonuclease BN (tRNA processing enzyme)
MGITVTVLGSSGMFATVERACSGYLVEIDGFNLWMDAGAGTWRNLLAYIDFRELNGLLLSHRHPDHTTDSLQAFHARKYGVDEPLAPIPLWAPGEALELVAGYSGESKSAFDFHEIDDASAVEIRGARLTFVRTAHPPVTFGVRIEHADGIVAYSSDTGEETDFKQLAGDSDIFLCEATFQDRDDKWMGHLRASQAAHAATLAAARHLVLTHLPPGRDHELSLVEARAATDVDVSLAADGLRLDVTN